jgi:hypothetical protein
MICSSGCYAVSAASPVFYSNGEYYRVVRVIQAWQCMLLDKYREILSHETSPKGASLSSSLTGSNRTLSAVNFKLPSLTLHLLEIAIGA